jgi:hypothetical protein
VARQVRGGAMSCEEIHRTFFAARARSRLADFCEKLTFCEIFSQKNFFEKIFKNSRKMLDNHRQM